MFMIIMIKYDILMIRENQDNHDNPQSITDSSCFEKTNTKRPRYVAGPLSLRG
jgi:hypothetical protein